eukprot:CAMPEP_0168363678 /NCGR_PEP_ID=MMETSP0228-20121227/3813_1 /TAXON_ID=133427 /ORGANISM="Protoceratium reticulatum, Strain CCCM 535 (=CCMP 1889)" /LENGTH=49 /DNA_ID= /DNA_START= /DNA_END= /DNA_ORIENTATION=
MAVCAKACGAAMSKPGFSHRQLRSMLQAPLGFCGISDAAALAADFSRTC